MDHLGQEENVMPWSKDPFVDEGGFAPLTASSSFRPATQDEMRRCMNENKADLLGFIVLIISIGALAFVWNLI